MHLDDPEGPDDPKEPKKPSFHADFIKSVMGDLTENLNTEDDPNINPDIDEERDFNNSECIESLIQYIVDNHDMDPTISRLLGLLRYLDENLSGGFEDVSRPDILTIVRLGRSMCNYLDTGELENAKLCVYTLSALFAEPIRDAYLSSLEKLHLDFVNHPYYNLVNIHLN